jgi:uncharacterized LabA/DUF88 family protein
MAHPETPLQRVAAYVDGFNLYYGLKSKGWRRYYWLNVHQLMLNILKPDQRLVFTKYFTSRVSSTPRNPEKQKRQSDFIEALLTVPGVQIFYGQYQLRPQTCNRCGFVGFVPNEKMTDVNIAAEMLTDAFQDKFDTALLVSADSDLAAPVSRIRDLFPHKRVVVAFPPGRVSKHLRQLASAYFIIGREKLERSQFPDVVIKPDGFRLHRPARWA